MEDRDPASGEKGIKKQTKNMEESQMKQKLMLLGIAVILAAIAFSMNNILALGGGAIGLLIAIIGFFL